MSGPAPAPPSAGPTPSSPVAHNNGALEQDFTLAEVAARLRISERTLRRRLAEHPEIRPPRPGRAIVFTRRDIEALEEALRCRSRSSHPASAKGTPGTSSAARSPESCVSSAQKREIRRRLAALRLSSNSPSSTVVSLQLRQK